MSKISVCIATYNGEKYIKEQLDSIIIQLGKDDEIIISDDGSSDETVKIINSYEDNRIKVYKNELKRGYVKNFENAIYKSSGDIIFLCDQDDVWMEDKIKKSVKKLNEFDLVISDAIITDESLNIVYPSFFDRFKTKTGFLVNYIRPRCIGATMSFRKEILTKVLPFPKNQNYCAHDYWIIIICEIYYKVGLINEPLIKYRRHGKNVSSGAEKNDFTFSRKILIRIYAFYNLLIRKFFIQINKQNHIL